MNSPRPNSGEHPRRPLEFGPGQPVSARRSTDVVLERADRFPESAHEAGQWPVPPVVHVCDHRVVEQTVSQFLGKNFRFFIVVRHEQASSLQRITVFSDTERIPLLVMKGTLKLPQPQCDTVFSRALECTSRLAVKGAPKNPQSGHTRLLTNGGSHQKNLRKRYCQKLWI